MNSFVLKGNIKSEYFIKDLQLSFDRYKKVTKINGKKIKKIKKVYAAVIFY